MRRNLLRLLALSALVGVALTAGSQRAQRPFLADKQGRFAIFNVASGRADFQPGGGIAFEAAGTPVNGYSLEQNLEFKMREIKGETVQTKGGPMRLKSGQARGGVEITVNRNASRTTLGTELATIADDGEAARITLPGTFTMNDETATANRRRSIQVRGTSGRFVLETLTNAKTDPLRTADVSGPVTLRMVTDSARQAGTDKNVIDARGDSMTYNRATRRLVLSGDVTINSLQSPAQGAGFEGVMTVDRMEVEFDENYQIKTVRTSTGRGDFQESRGG
ncbi:MAG: hypothetical protein KIT11_07685 [Fimbriimonadaceae bacterium]|nr:hypothetical protein [Fimbriimonadaceae bacterium]QYK56234.1 MAG: hypothetical protein KF733_01875 [Fimbriimonadaceae bacterium]